MLKPEHLAGAAPAGHHLVQDHHDAVLVAQGAHAFHVALGRQEDAVGARNRFHHDGGDGGGVFVCDLLFQLGQVEFRGLLLGRKADGLAVNVGVEEFDKARNAGFQRVAAGFAGEVSRAERRAVVAAVAAEHLPAAGCHARHFDGVLVGFRARVGEEHLGHVIGHQADDPLGEPRPHVGAVAGGQEAILVHLRFDGVADLPVAKAEVQVDQLRGHVRVALAVRVPEIDAVRLLNRDRVDGFLHAP